MGTARESNPLRVFVANRTGCIKLALVKSVLFLVVVSMFRCGLTRSLRGIVSGSVFILL